MRKRFILLIDFSEYSKNLIQYAYDWSRQTNARILLLHKTTVLLPAFADNDTKQQMVQNTNENALAKLKKFAKSIIPYPYEASYCVSEKHLQHTLSDRLKEPFEDLVFVGMKGTGMMEKLFLGSIALQVIDQTNNSVVAIPKEINTYSHEKIFVGVSENNPFNTLEFNSFLRFIDDENTNITFFYLAKPNEETSEMKNLLRQLASLFDNRFSTDFAIYEGQSRLEDIKKVINNKIDEMLVVQKGSRLLTDQFFRRFLINDLVYEGQTPLIVLP